MTLRALYDVAAPAKLNLFLHVVGRRPDGYHLLQSLFVLIDWCDTLHFERRGDGRLARHDLGEPLPDDDLCLRAARALQVASGTSLGADIQIEKRLPTGAGLGGGSSDAASTLIALNRLWGLNWSTTRLRALGLSLGADVPFFVGGRNAFVEGIGEQLTAVEVRPQWLAVLKPAAGLETATVFKSGLLVCQNSPDTIESFDSSADSGGAPKSQAYFARFVEAGRNDLQPVAEAICPEVAQAAAMLRYRFGNSRMTGSGSAVFAHAGWIDEAGCTPAATMLLMPAAGWVGRMCRSLPGHPLAEWSAE